jgi:endoglucanase
MTRTRAAVVRLRRHRSACFGIALSATLLVATMSATSAHARERRGEHRPATTQFAHRRPDRGALAQISRLRRAGHRDDANLIADMVNTPQAEWLTGGTPREVRRQARTYVRHARNRVAVLVVYNVPGRDCSQYSAGGAGSDAAYRAWIDGLVAGLGRARAMVLVEPDGLANLPSDCPAAYPGQDIAALTAARIADIAYAGQQIEIADPNSLVYLDAGHSAWHSVGDMAQRLYQAGVGGLQGFFLNVSNYQYTPNSDYYGTWLSDCLAYATPVNSAHAAVAAGDFGSCGDEYYNGGPANNWVGGAMSPYGEWSDTSSEAELNTAGVDSRYAQELGNVAPTAHFVVDTSRNGTGPADMSTYAGAPYNQSAATVAALQAGNWCNPPGRGVGVRPAAHPASTSFPLVDAYLWVKTVGESDGQCNIEGGARAWDYTTYNPWNWSAAQQLHNDPLWGVEDPAAGAWFDQQALQLARNAVPALSGRRHGDK